MPTTITYIISNVQKALAFEWISDYFQQQGSGISFILLNPTDTPLEQYLRDRGVRVSRIKYTGKRDLWRAFWQVRRVLRQYKTTVLHCHLFDACVVGLLAARSLGIRKRIFTRHHATIHHDYFPRAVMYDKLLNALATDIIAISRNVLEILRDREGVKASKIHLIHHGFDLQAFAQVPTERVQLLRQKYQIPSDALVVGVIARQTVWKGIQYIIPAFAEILEQYPKAHLLLANAHGEYATEIDQLLGALPKNSYTKIRFEDDLYALYQLLAVYVHTPINARAEAFGQTYVEALAAGIPSVFTLSGVASEFIQHEYNALVVPYQDSAAIAQAIQTLIQDAPLRDSIVQQGRASVQSDFTLEVMMQQLEVLYAER